MALDAEEGASLIARGFRAIAFGGDLWIYQQALREGLGVISTLAKTATCLRKRP